MGVVWSFFFVGIFIRGERSHIFYDFSPFSWSYQGSILSKKSGLQNCRDFFRGGRAIYLSIFTLFTCLFVQKSERTRNHISDISDMFFFLSGFHFRIFRGGRAIFFKIFLHIHGHIRGRYQQKSQDYRIVGIFSAGGEPYYVTIISIFKVILEVHICTIDKNTKLSGFSMEGICPILVDILPYFYVILDLYGQFILEIINIYDFSKTLFKKLYLQN